jgi:hypothetical protein
MGFEKGKLFVNKYEWDFAVDGGAQGVIAFRNLGANDIAAGCHIKRVWVVANTAVTSAGTPTLIIGNTTDDDGYFEDIFALVTTSAKLTVAGGEVAGALIWDDTNDHSIEYSPLVANDLDLNLTIGTADATAGKLTVYIEFYRS